MAGSDNCIKRSWPHERFTQPPVMTLRENMYFSCDPRQVQNSRKSLAHISFGGHFMQGIATMPLSLKIVTRKGVYVLSQPLSETPPPDAFRKEPIKTQTGRGGTRGLSRQVACEIGGMFLFTENGALRR